MPFPEFAPALDLRFKTVSRLTSMRPVGSAHGARPAGRPPRLPTAVDHPAPAPRGEEAPPIAARSRWSRHCARAERRLGRQPSHFTFRAGRRLRLHPGPRCSNGGKCQPPKKPACQSASTRGLPNGQCSGASPTSMSVPMQDYRPKAVSTSPPRLIHLLGYVGDTLDDVAVAERCDPVIDGPEPDRPDRNNATA